MALDLSKSFLEKNRKGRLKEIESALKRRFGVSNEDPYPPEREEITLPQPVEPVEKLLTEKKAIEKIKDFSMQTVPKRSDMFNHAGQFSQGVSTKGIRTGMGTFVVALDGSGDFDNIQEAIDALSSNGGVIYIKEGVYTITGFIKINVNNTSLIGTGKATKIQTSGNHVMISANTLSGIFLSKLYLYGNGIGLNNVGIHLENCSNSCITNCWIENCGESGIWLESSGDENYILNNWVKSGNQNGITVESSDYTNISNNFCLSNKSHGISINANNCIIQGNICKDNDVNDTATYNGIHIESGDYNIITGNRCESNDNFEINIKDNTCNKTIIIGNICIGGDHQGAINDAGANTHPNGASGTANLALDDLNIIA